jgi:tetrahedral aminopeptidase
MHDRDKHSASSTAGRAGGKATGGLSAESRRFLDELLLTPSPTGDEQRIQRLIRDRMADVADLVEPDLHGNLVLGVHTAARRRKVMLFGHCDQLGFLVKYVSDGGYLYLDPLGGIDYGVLLGASVVVHARGGPVPGVVGRKPIHLQTSQEMTQIPVPNQIWVDIGARDRDEALERVRLGDSVTVRLGVTELLNGRLAAPGLDNKAGLFVCLEALRRCAALGDLAVALYAASTVQEEIGSRGAATAALAVQPEVGIAVDVVNATDDPGPGSPQQQVQCKLGGGPALSSGPGTNVVAARLLREAADRVGAPRQDAPSGQTAGNDAKPVQVARGGGVATASVGIPQRNMHTQVEVCALSDLEDCVRVLVEFVRSIRADTDFRPISADDHA